MGCAWIALYAIMELWSKAFQQIALLTVEEALKMPKQSIVGKSQGQALSGINLAL